MRRWLIGLVVLAGVLVATPADAQQLTNAEETITVSTTAIGVTADLCGTSNTGGAYVQVTTNAIYFTVHSPTATPDSNDFRMNAGTTGPQFWVKPASKLRMLRQSADSLVKVSCSE